MRLQVAGVGLALALLLSGCGKEGDGNSTVAKPSAPIAAVPAPNGGDWTQVVNETPEGGFVMGNPDAPVKLVEYASLSCPHCADLSERGGPTIQNEFVKSGRVSWEFRPFLLFPTDAAVTLLARCQGPAPFFLITEQLYATQRDWMSKVQALPAEQLGQLQTLPPSQSMPIIIRGGGLDAFFRQRGMPEAKLNACLADAAALDRLVQITDRGRTEFEVTGTPTFFINGAKQDFSGWEGLQPALRTALGE